MGRRRAVVGLENGVAHVWDLEHVSTDATILCAKLEGLLHRQPEVHQLREDVSITTQIAANCRKSRLICRLPVLWA